MAGSQTPFRLLRYWVPRRASRVGKQHVPGAPCPDRCPLLERRLGCHCHTPAPFVRGAKHSGLCPGPSPRLSPNPGLIRILLGTPWLAGLPLLCIPTGLGMGFGVGLGLGMPWRQVESATSTLLLGLSLATSLPLALYLRPGGYTPSEGLMA